MTQPIDHPQRTALARQRRSNIRWLNVNALVYGLGAGMVTSQLISFMARTLGAPGTAIGLVLAAPSFAGMLRLGTPSLLTAVGSRKGLSMVCFAASGIVIALLPWLAYPRGDATRLTHLGTLIGLWCVYHVLEQLASIALYAWFRELVPRPFRSLMLGRRKWYLLIGNMLGLTITWNFVYSFQTRLPNIQAFIAYMFPTTVGGLILMLAVIPLWFVAAGDDDEAETKSSQASKPLPINLLAPLRDPNFWPLLRYNLWQAFSSALSGAAMPTFYTSVLEIQALPVRLAGDSVTRLGQAALGTETGRMVRRHGSRTVMLWCQTIVALSLVFLIFTTREHWWLMLGSAICWIAYVGINVGEDSLLLRLPPRQLSSSYLTVFFALGGLCAGLGSVLGGLLFDLLGSAENPRLGPEPALNFVRVYCEDLGVSRFQLFFLLGLAARWLTVALVRSIREE